MTLRRPHLLVLAALLLVLLAGGVFGSLELQGIVARIGDALASGLAAA